VPDALERGGRLGRFQSGVKPPHSKAFGALFSACWCSARTHDLPGDAMRPYMLVRDGIPREAAVGALTLRAVLRKDRSEMADWLIGSPEMSFRRVDDEEFERAHRLPGAIVLCLEEPSTKEVAIVFGPADERDEFAQLRDLIEDDLRREEERLNITEEIWLNCDSRPLDLANYQLPRVDKQTLRRFVVGCCELVIDAMDDSRSRAAVETARKSVEGLASADELKAAFEQARQAWRDRNLRDQGSPAYAAACLAMCAATPHRRAPSEDTTDGWTSPGGSISDLIIRDTIIASGRDRSIEAKISRLLREVCGNPFEGTTR
jgi:hypothetical protein